MIEVNPASAIQDFRCVWSRFHATVGDEGQLCHVWRRFDAGQLDEFIIFTVTDFNYSSPANLQRCGTRLAYNYLLVRRDPLPL